jgi:hypothetical protein
VLRIVLVVAIALAAIVALSVCGDGFGDECFHASSWRAERSEPIARKFLGWVSRLLASSGVLAAFVLLGIFLKGATLALESALPPLPLPAPSALRI